MELTLLFRMYGSADIRSFAEETRNRLAPIDLHMVMCTNSGDSLAEVAPTLDIEVLYADMKKFDEPLNLLFHKAHELRRHALVVSPGVGIEYDHVERALDACNRRAKVDGSILVHGWQIEGQLNDGTAPGRLIYNTAALYSPSALAYAAKDPIPDFVNNGSLGRIQFDYQGEVREGLIGGGEETVQMCMLSRGAQYWPNEEDHPIPYGDDDILFVHNATTILPMPVKTSTGGIGFDFKIARKVPVARFYLERLGMTEEQLLRHIQII